MKIFGVQIDELTRAQARAQLNEKQLIFTPNPEILLEARHNEAFRRALKKGTLMIPDGNGLLLVSTLLRFKSRILRFLLFFPAGLLFLFWKRPFKKILPEIIHGSDFMDDVLACAEREGWSVFFLGGRDGVAKRTADLFLKQYPHLKVAGVSSVDPTSAFEVVSLTRPQVLFVAYGAPKQELWIAEHAPKLPSLRLVMGVGGSFDFYSGAIRRAPSFMRTLGLEWLWRLLLNPRQRIKRIWNAVVVFPLRALIHK